MAKVVVVKFKNSKPYYFEAGDLALSRGQAVIVETARGLEYGIVADPAREVADEEITPPLKPVVRIANERDEELVARARERRKEAMNICREKIEKHGLEMKLIDCEFSFDGNKVIFTFSAEGRVDFRELVKDLASVFHMRIELRQVGARDETKILGGIAPCGRECCCSGCMPEFRKVSIKMAKNQGLSLNPGKISGLCGRLMCCLSYENEYYASVCKQMPKIGATVATPEGKGVVMACNMLKLEVRVKIERDGALVYRDFPVADIEPRRGEEREKEEPDDEGEDIAEEPVSDVSEKPQKPQQGQNARPQQPKAEGERGKRPDRGNRNHRRGGGKGGKN